MKAIYFLLLFFLLVGCTAPMTDMAKVSYTNRIGMIEDTVFFSDLDVFIPELTDQSLISGIDRVIEFDGAYYMLDKRMKQIIAYRIDGSFLFSIHAVGSGEGEYVNLMDFTLDYKDSLLVLLSYPSQLLYYDLKGHYVKEQKIDGNYHSITMDKNFIYLSQSTFVNNKLKETSVTIIDKNDNKSRKILKPLPEIAPYCFSKGSDLSIGNNILFTRRFDPVIYRLEGFSIKPYYSIEWGKYSFKGEKERYECQELNEICQKKQYIYAMSNFQESNHYVCFSTNLTGLYLMSKQDSTLNRYDCIINNEYGVVLPNYLPVGGNNHKVFFVCPAHILLGLYKNTNGNLSNEKSYSEKMMHLLERLNGDSNPVIFSYLLR